MYDRDNKATVRALLKSRDPHRTGVDRMTRAECVAVLEDLDNGGNLCRDLSKGRDFGGPAMDWGSSFRD